MRQSDTAKSITQECARTTPWTRVLTKIESIHQSASLSVGTRGNKPQIKTIGQSATLRTLVYKKKKNNSVRSLFLQSSLVICITRMCFGLHSLQKWRPRWLGLNCNFSSLGIPKVFLGISFRASYRYFVAVSWFLDFLDTYLLPALSIHILDNQKDMARRYKFSNTRQPVFYVNTTNSPKLK